MRILISGPRDSGQLDVLEAVVGYRPVDDLDLLDDGGVTHRFVNRYFSVTCGVWVDEMEDVEDWANQFCGREAAEVRDAIALFILTCKDPSAISQRGYDSLSKFVKMMKPGSCVAVSDYDDKIRSIGFDILYLDELEHVVFSAIYDRLNGDDDTSEDIDKEERLDSKYSDEEEEENQALDMDEIIRQLLQAKESKTMTNAEKKELADELAAKIT